MGHYALTLAFLFGICLHTAMSVAAPPPPPAPTTAAPGDLRCQEDDGTMMPSATVCDDDLSAATCTALFGAQVAPTATSRSPNCDNDELQDKAIQCARTCGICCEKPEYDCDDSKSKFFGYKNSFRHHFKPHQSIAPLVVGSAPTLIGPQS